MTPVTQGVFELDIVPFENVVKKLKLPNIWSSDLAIGDFDNDLDSDMFLSTITLSKSVVSQLGNSEIRSHLIIQNNEHGFSFKGSGNILFTIIGEVPKQIPIYVGLDGHSPDETTFQLSSEDPKVGQMYQHNKGKDLGIYIGFDSENEQWTILHSSSDLSRSNMVLSTNFPVQNLKYFETDPSLIYQNDMLLLNTKGGFTDATISSKIDNSTACRSVVAGDFDNDMDLDIYQACTLHTNNLLNILYENLGNGTFYRVPKAGNAEGSMNGIADTVTTVDYDNDGFLDLLITNGEGSRPFVDDGPTQLFRNMRNQNNWIELDLEGTISNRDGIGSRVLLTTDGITQLREQTNGIHHKSQNYQRIHFGLAENSNIEQIIVFWPSGIAQQLKNISSNQILKIVELSSPLSPLKQVNIGVLPEKVLCKENMEPIFKTGKNQVACVKESSINELVKRGWKEKI